MKELKLRALHIFFMVITLISSNCVSQKDYCYSEEVYDFHDRCELFAMVLSGSSDNADKRGPLFNMTLISCLLEMEKIKKCESKSNILPGTIGP